MHFRGDSVGYALKTGFLNIVSVIFKALSFVNLYFKSSRLQIYPGVVIVSVDNLSFGGTGKTSLVIELGRHLQAERVDFAIVTRGYRSLYERTGNKVERNHTVQEVGDEARLYQEVFPEQDIYIGRDRRVSIAQAVRDGNEVILLDDGFQSTYIKKDLAIMLWNPGHPYYYLRNFKWLMNREDIILVYTQPGVEITRKDATPGNPVKPRYGSYRFEPTGFRDGQGSKIEIHQAPVVAFAAVGDNRRFEEELRQMGVAVRAFRAFRDHHPYKQQDLEELEKLRVEKGARFLVCTWKDFIKIKPYNLQQIPFIYAENSIKFDIDLVEVILDYAGKKSNRQALG